jgi:hydrogenase maturation protease
MKTIVIGLGNPILGDDGVGWKVAEEISGLVLSKSDSIVVDCLSVGGLSLMEHMVGYNRAILVDTLQTGLHPPGTVIQMQLEDLPDQLAGHLVSAHDANLKTALQLGREMGVELPEQITIVGIEAQHVYDFTEVLSPDVMAAVPQAVQLVSDILQIV